jgi:hexosaminidase
MLAAAAVALALIVIGALWTPTPGAFAAGIPLVMHDARAVAAVTPASNAAYVSPVVPDAGAGADLAAPRINVIPLPAHVELRSGSFAIRAGTRLAIPRDPRAARVARYFADLVRETQGVRLGTANLADGNASADAIVFELRPTLAIGAVAASSPEAYTLDVSPKRVVLTASDPRGLFYAAVTLWQLSTAGPIPAVHIIDSPRFAWRGLMLDSARHYQSPEFILQFIDWMALHKLNVLHWHLTDDQAWRLEIKRYPRLTSVGAWRVPEGSAMRGEVNPPIYGGFYSQDTARKIVAHAAERHITIVPEIDMPGHATAAVVAYPRLASVVPAPAAVPSDWGVYSNLYNADEGTFEFLENVLSEVVQLFPGNYVHVGGDEAVKDQWKASPHIQERIRELGVSNEEGLQRYFVERIGKFLTAHHRRLIGWDEILEGGIPHDATIMSWRGVDGAYAAAGEGHDAVLSPSPTLYFDNRQDAADTQPGRGHVSSVQDVYKFDPMPASLAPAQRAHILGLQANIWTEHIRTEERVEYMTFPRAAAVAEVGWSPAGSLRWDDFQARLPEQMHRYQLLGIKPYVSTSQPHAGLLSQELRSCTDKVVLSLEDDLHPAAALGSVFQVDIMNPCWIYPAADLSSARSFVAAVGQVPFNFQLGADIHNIKLNPPRTPAGELEVRVDNCEGDPVAVLSLQTALGNQGVTQLPAARIAARDGKHDLCLKFTQRSLEPLWVIDRVRLE